MDNQKRENALQSIQPKKGRTKGILLGIPLAFVVFAILQKTLIAGIVFTVFGEDSISAILTLLIYFVIMCIPAILLGKYFEKQNAKKREYLSFVENHRILSLDEISQKMTMPYEEVKKDVDKMIQHGFFGNAHIDVATRSIVLPINGVDINTKITETTMVCPTCGATCKISSIGKNKCEYCGTVLK